MFESQRLMIVLVSRSFTVLVPCNDLSQIFVVRIFVKRTTGNLFALLLVALFINKRSEQQIISFLQRIVYLHVHVAVVTFNY